MSLASRLALEAEIETATRLEQILTRDHRQTATPRGDHSMALGPSPTAVVVLEQSRYERNVSE